jgi:hypothetical protein
VSKIRVATVFISVAVLAACGGGGSDTPAAVTPAPVATSASSTSGAIGAFTKDGATYSLTPGSTGSAGAGTANLLTFPNTGNLIGAITVAQLQKTPIQTSLKTAYGTPAPISGTAVDPGNDVGMAFNYNISKISLFRLSTATEISTYDAKTTGGLSYSGASNVAISGAVMDATKKLIILATADGFQMVDYSNVNAPTLVKTIPSLAKSATAGVEIMENFAYDSMLASGPTIITGGSENGGPVMVLANPVTGAVYKPDAATALLFKISDYIDSAAVDTTYHVAILADESTGTTFVDLNQLTLNAAAGTYSLPAKAVSRIITYYKMDNLGIESTNHLVMMGEGYGGSTIVVAELANPAVKLGFAKEVKFSMPSGKDDQAVPATVYWSGGGDPHAAGAYLDSKGTSRGLWMSNDGTHIANIDLRKVLDGALASSSYNPLTTAPQDIVYFKIP